jgi:hypothetical protein
MMSDCQKMIKIQLSFETNLSMSVVFVQHISWFVVCRCEAQRWLMTMEKVKQGRAMLVDWER